MHPATLLLLWASGLVVMQQQRLPLLAALAVLSLLLACVWARARCLQMLRRTRWLLLTTAVLLLWGTPGEYLSALPGVSVEGVILATHQLLCLLLFLAWLSLLLQRLGTQRLIMALYTLFAPLRIVGLDRDKAALRLLLVMDALEQAAPAAGWREWLRHAEVPAETRQAIELPQMRFAWQDFLVLVCALVVVCL